MSIFLFGLTGKLKALVDRTANAANLDNANAAVSTIAPASSAASTADYTAARAAALDQILGSIKAYADPRRLPLWWTRDNALWQAGTYVMSATSFWTSDILNSDQCAQATIAADDTYVTLVDHSGSGTFSGVIGPIHSASGQTTTFKITMDGKVYTITGSLGGTTIPSTYPRLALWATDGVVYEESISPTWTNTDRIPVSENTMTAVKLSNPIISRIYNHAHCYYTTGLKVEVKISTRVTTTDPYMRCLVGYLPEKGTVA
jgi:hypothetical protein